MIGGDTGPSEGLISLARGADLLVHEGAWHDEQIEGFGLRGVHTSAPELARVARAAGVKRIVVTGIPAVNDDPATLDALQDTVRRGFSGDVAVATDLMMVEL